MTPTGLLIHVLTDQEWQDHLANRAVSPNGTITVAAHPTSPRHVPIVAGMTAPTIAVAKYANERHQLWHDIKALMKRLIVNSLGPTLSAIFGPPPHGFTLRSIRQIMDSVNAKFENVDAVVLDALEEVLLTPLESVYDLEKHVSRLTRYIMISNNSGFPIEEYRQVRIFRKSVQGQFQISCTLETFDDAHLNPKRHTFALITNTLCGGKA